MNTAMLRKLIDTVMTLRTKLKCPICLDIMQQVIELDCGHKYCKDCYVLHKSSQNQPSCPLCKKVFKRRSAVYTDNYASTLGKFVYNCCENIRIIYKCEVEQLQKQLSRERELPLHTKTTNLQQNVTNIINYLDAPSTSKATSEEVKNIKSVIDKCTTKIDKKKATDESLKENCDTAFDKLMKAQPVTAFNKKGTKRVYLNKKKIKGKPKVEYDILEFDNYENKAAVLRWLHDTRNKFDRLSQTQNCTSEETGEVPGFDLISISQVKVAGSECKPSTAKVNRARAKSLDIEIKKILPTQQHKQTGSVDFENYSIEDINTEEDVVKKAEKKVILDLMENEFLNNLENEMQNTIDLKCNETKRQSKSKKTKHLSPTTTTGWERITKIEKTIKRNEKVPKQLNITLQSTQESKNEKKSVMKDSNKQNVLKLSGTDKQKQDGKESITNEKTDIENKSRPPEDELSIRKIIEVGDINNPTQAQKQTYDLEQLEDYITRNIKTIEKNTTSDDILSCAKERYEGNDTSVQHGEVRTTQKSIISNDTEKSTKTNKTTVVQEKQKANSQNIAEKVNEKSNTNNCTLLDDLFSMPTQQDPQENVVIKLEENEVALPDGDNFEVKPDVHCLNENEKRNRRDVLHEDELASLYASATQKIHNNVANLQLEEHDSVEGVLYLFEDCLEKCIRRVKCADKAVEDNLFNLKYYLSKLKLLHENNTGLVQANAVERVFCNAETQVSVKVDDKCVQTKENKDNVGVQTEVFQTEENKDNVGVQTEDFYCDKCGINFSRTNVPRNTAEISQNTKVAIESMLNETNSGFKSTLHSTVSKKSNNSPLKKQTQNDIFTCTLDNLNFETQELAKNQIITAKLPSGKNIIKPMATQNQEDASVTVIEKVNNEKGDIVPGSLLVCSLISDKPTTSKKVNHKLSYDTDRITRFKRIRLPTSDSDSEDENSAKRKCNRFVRDDLTVEFLTNSNISDLKKGNKTSALDLQDSEGINYDEYLAEVMKKYDDNLSVKSSNSNKLDNLTPKQEMIKRWEDTSGNTRKSKSQPKRVPEVSATSSKDSFQTASDSICNNLDEALVADDIFMNEDNLMKLDSDIREYEKNTSKAQNSEISDIIVETEEMEPLPNKRRKSCVTKSNPKKTNVPENNDPFFENQSNEAEMKKSEEASSAAVKPHLKRKINVLANVKIKSQDQKGCERKEEDDLFSDEDIVETTPQKKVDSFGARLAHSQMVNSISLINSVFPDGDNADSADILLPPPQEFQDDIIDPSSPEVSDNDDVDLEKGNATLINLNKSSLTPDNLSQLMYPGIKNCNTPKLSPYIPEFTKKNSSFKSNSNVDSVAQKVLDKEVLDEDKLFVTPNKVQQDANQVQRNMCHSTPIMDVDLARESLGFSPISAKKSQKMGLAEMAQAAKYTPLSMITKQTPPKQNLLTSLPGQKSIWNYVKPSQSKAEVQPTPKTKPCIAGTRLTKDQVQLISQLTNKKIATYSSQFDSSVTHLIVNVNDENCVKDYTIKFVSAVAAGIWVLRFEWVEECLKNNSVVAEELFEVSDISGAPGPKTSRLTRKTNPLFKGYKFFCAKPFISTTRKEISSILIMLGGKVLNDLHGLLEDDGNIGIIIAEGHATQDFEQYERWVEEYKTVTVDIEWMSKCVGQYKILSIRPFVWCCEDNLCDLGYPTMLTETVPFTFTETF